MCNIYKYIYLNILNIFKIIQFIDIQLTLATFRHKEPNIYIKSFLTLSKAVDITKSNLTHFQKGKSFF